MDAYEARHLAEWCGRRCVTAEGAEELRVRLLSVWCGLDEATRDDVRRLGWGYLAQMSVRESGSAERCCDDVCARSRAEVAEWDRPHADASACAACGGPIGR